LEKCVGYSLKNLGPSQKTLRPPWCPKLFPGLVAPTSGSARVTKQRIVSINSSCYPNNAQESTSSEQDIVKQELQKRDSATLNRIIRLPGANQFAKPPKHEPQPSRVESDPTGVSL